MTAKLTFEDTEVEGHDTEGKEEGQPAIVLEHGMVEGIAYPMALQAAPSNSTTVGVNAPIAVQAGALCATFLTKSFDITKYFKNENDASIRTISDAMTKTDIGPWVTEGLHAAG